jgi:hypothetical protein
MVSRIAIKKKNKWRLKKTSQLVETETSWRWYNVKKFTSKTNLKQ